MSYETKLWLSFAFLLLFGIVVWSYDLQSGTIHLHYIPEIVCFFVLGLLTKAYQCSFEFGTILVGSYLLYSIIFPFILQPDFHLDSYLAFYIISLVFLVPFFLGYRFGTNGGDLID